MALNYMADDADKVRFPQLLWLCFEERRVCNVCGRG